MSTRNLLIDTDTASDDAVALIMALRSPQVRVLAITVVAGNVGLEQGTAQRPLHSGIMCCPGAGILRRCGAVDPSPRGRRAGFTGTGRAGRSKAMGHPTRAPEKEFAVDAMVRVIEANPGIEVITLGPLTNLALALRQSPGIGCQGKPLRGHGRSAQL